MPKVAIVIGSRSDAKAGEEVMSILKEYGISCDFRVISAHRNPDELDAFIKNTDSEVFIAIAGLSAALPGVIASKTVRPVIGLPMNVKLEGLDAFLSMAQMPPGVPVATVGVDNSRNAALLAVEILAIKYPEMRGKLEDIRRKK